MMMRQPQGLSIAIIAGMPSTIDESPFAYKDAGSILERVQETVSVEHRLKPIYNFKAH